MITALAAQQRGEHQANLDSDVGAPNRTSNGNPFTVFDVMSYCKDGNDANSAWTSAPGWTRDTNLLQLGYPPVRR